jgi:hypothetical protein
MQATLLPEAAAVYYPPFASRLVDAIVFSFYRLSLLLHDNKVASRTVNPIRYLHKRVPTEEHRRMSMQE